MKKLLPKNILYVGRNWSSMGANNTFENLLKFLPKSISVTSKDLKYFAADWDFWLSVYEKKIIGAETETILYHRRNHSENVINRNIDKWPEVIKIIIDGHPNFFSKNNRRRKALYSVYEKLARHYRTTRQRKKAADYARIALENGDSTTTLMEIIKEERMSRIRYVMRLLGKLI